MAFIAAQKASHAGTNPTYTAANGGGDTFPCGAHTVLIAKTAGTAITLTLAIPGAGPTGVATPDNAVSLPATGERWIPLSQFYGPSDSIASATYSAVTNLTVAVMATD
jgi:hypothetical protein